MLLSVCNNEKKKKKNLNFRFVADFEDLCLTDTKERLAYVSSIQNESEVGDYALGVVPLAAWQKG